VVWIISVALLVGFVIVNDEQEFSFPPLFPMQYVTPVPPDDLVAAVTLLPCSVYAFQSPLYVLLLLPQEMTTGYLQVELWPRSIGRVPHQLIKRSYLFLPLLAKSQRGSWQLAAIACTHPVSQRAPLIPPAPTFPLLSCQWFAVQFDFQMIPP